MKSSLNFRLHVLHASATRRVQLRWTAQPCFARRPVIYVPFCIAVQPWCLGHEHSCNKQHVQGHVIWFYSVELAAQGRALALFEVWI